MSLSPDPAKVIFFPEGHGFVLISVLANTGSSRVIIVKSLKDGKLYVRKESEPEAVMEQQATQSEEVRVNSTLADVDGIPNLIGWTEYHDEQSSNNFITASYWELFNRGTLEQLSLELQARPQSLSENCLWSIYSQMLKTMVETIEKGIVHTDAHAGNWFIDMENGTLPKLGLGDWGTVEIKPTQHLRLCTASSCDKACPVKAWWNTCGENLKTFVPSHVRTLAAIGNGSSQLKQRSPYLALLLEHIETHPPCNFGTGEAWFTAMETLSEWVANVVQRARNTLQYVHVHRDSDFQDLRSSRLPSFDSAMAQARLPNPDAEEYGQSPHFWRVAHVNEASGTLVALERHHGRSGYEDYTDHPSLPIEWLGDHLQLGQTIDSLEADMEPSEDQVAIEDYDTGFEAYY